MHLERVELQGFKSFTRRAEVSFCPNFTVVTGPNGSGKSNVLDAVCFALTEDDLSHLRVRSMQELVSTDASVDKAAVVLTFTADQGAGGAEKTRLSATVKKKDGAREFKLDGVRKPVKDVRLWLKNRGLDVEGASNILYQNTVVSLSEKTGTQLAAMVMAASGGTCFDSMIQSVNRNIDKAEQEKRLTEDKIQQFQRDIGADSVKMKMIDDHDTIVAEIAAKSSSIATAELAGAYREEGEVKDQLLTLQSQREVGEQSLREHNRGADASAQEQKLLSDLEKANESHSKSIRELRGNQELQAEEAEEEAQLESQLAEQQEEHDETKRTLHDLLKSKKLVAARQVEVYDELARNDTELQRLADLLRAPDTAQDAAARIAALRSSLAAQQTQHGAFASKRQRMQKQLDQLVAAHTNCAAACVQQTQQVTQLRDMHATQDTDTVADEQEEDSLARRLASVDVSLETVRHQLEIASTKANSRGGRSSSSNRSSAAAGQPQPLVRQLCFGEQAEPYLDALNEIAGSKLQAVLVKDVNAGEKLLKQKQSGKGGVVIWPLDRLQPNISTSEEAHVASVVEECQGEALLPSSVLSFAGGGPLSSVSDVPFRRVFGGWAISTTPRATAHLVRKGIRTCELNGTKHVPGMVSGGYLGGGERRNAVRAEFESQKELASSKALEERSAALEAESASLTRRLQASTDLRTAVEQQAELEAKLSSNVRERAGCEEEIGELERSERLASQQIEMIATELQNRLSQDVSTVRSGLQETQANLTQQNANLKSELGRLVSDKQQADADETQLTASLRTMSIAMGGHSDDDDGDDPMQQDNEAEDGATSGNSQAHAYAQMQRDIAQHRQTRRELVQAEAALSSSVDHSAAACSELQGAIDTERQKAMQADEQLQGMQQELQRIDNSLASGTDRLKALAAKQKQIIKTEKMEAQQQRDARAQAEAQATAGTERAAADDAHVHVVDTAELRIEVKVLEQRLSEVCAELSEGSENGDGNVTAAAAAAAAVDLSALAAKQAQLREFTEKRDTIDNAISKLGEEIASSEQKKNRANRKAFTAISKTFEQYFAMLAPSKEAQLRKGDPPKHSSATTGHENEDDDSGSDSGSDTPAGEATSAADSIEQVHFVVRTRRRTVQSHHTSVPMGTDTEEEDNNKDDQQQGDGGDNGEMAWKASAVELSGGQRTLLGLAFVLAIAKYQPSPVYILDEVDAALDEGNQARVALLVSQVLGHEQRCQTIAISHHADFQRGAARVTEIGKAQGVGSCVVNSFDRVPG